MSSKYVPRDGLHGISALASAVLEKALSDAINPLVPHRERMTARAFLRLEDPFFRFWCDVADSRPEIVARAVAHRCKSSRVMRRTYSARADHLSHVT
jgi:hypothetical protein